jgi:hypothetical protein
MRESREQSWRRGRAGGGKALSVAIASQANPLVICRLEASRDEDEAPCVLSAALGYTENPNAALAVGLLEVVGVVSWGTDGYGASAEFDVPAGGAVISLPGGGGDVELRCYATGGSTETVEVEGQIGIGSSPHAPATRTLLHTLPGDAAVVRKIPAFARRVQFEVSDPTVFGVAGISLAFMRESAFGGASVLSRAFFVSGWSFPIPAGSRYFMLTGAAPAVAVRTVWELCL